MRNQKSLTQQPSGTSTQLDAVVDLASLVITEQPAGEQQQQQQPHPRLESALETSQIDLMINSSTSDRTNSPTINHQQPKTPSPQQLSEASISYKALLVNSDDEPSRREDTHDYDNVQGLRNDAYHHQEEANGSKSDK